MHIGWYPLIVARTYQNGVLQSQVVIPDYMNIDYLLQHPTMDFEFLDTLAFEPLSLERFVFPGVADWSKAKVTKAKVFKTK